MIKVSELRTLFYSHMHKLYSLNETSFQSKGFSGSLRTEEKSYIQVYIELCFDAIDGFENKKELDDETLFLFLNKFVSLTKSFIEKPTKQETKLYVKELSKDFLNDLKKHYDESTKNKIELKSEIILNYTYETAQDLMRRLEAKKEKEVKIENKILKDFNVLCPKCKKDFFVLQVEENDFKEGIEVTCPECEEDITLYKKNMYKKTRIKRNNKIKKQSFLKIKYYQLIDLFYEHKIFNVNKFLIGFFKIPYILMWLIVLLLISKIINTIFIKIGFSIEPFGVGSFILFYIVLIFFPLVLIYIFLTDKPKRNSISYFIGGFLGLLLMFFLFSLFINNIPALNSEKSFQISNGQSIKLEMNKIQYMFYNSLNKGYLMDYISQVPIFDTYIFNNDPYTQIIVNIRNRKYSKNNDDEIVKEVVALVQNIKYDYSKLDSLSFQVKFPYETLYSNKGVCIDKSLLLIKLLKKMDYNVVLLTFEDINHAGVGIKCDKPNFEEFCYIESTNNFKIGEMPDIVKNKKPSISHYGGSKTYKVY